MDLLRRGIAGCWLVLAWLRWAAAAAFFRPRARAGPGSGHHGFVRLVGRCGPRGAAAATGLPGGRPPTGSPVCVGWRVRVRVLHSEAAGPLAWLDGAGTPGCEFTTLFLSRNRFHFFSIFTRA